jgi:DNA-binding HxlR family transcriptional regulator
MESAKSKAPVARAAAKQKVSAGPRREPGPETEALVREILERVADKWTLLVLDVLAENGELRFTRVGQMVGNVSQKMLTKTLRQMERDGLVKRTVHPVIPPHVDYKLTPLGLTLGEAFCGVWLWVERHSGRIVKARAAFDARSK